LLHPQQRYWLGWKIHEEESLDQYQYTGGAHGLTAKYAFNIDRETGETLSLGEFLKTVDLDLEKINNFIEKKIEENPRDYHPNLGFSEIGEEQDYFLENSQVVIFFHQYEFASFAMGFPKFKIEY